jgi:DNA repair protein SbcC/Rad50
MRLNRLRLTNFRLHADTRIDFESGLTGIIGPNGSGKTTILEGIAWALYGMTAVRGKRQDVRSLRASGRAGVKVELDFDLAGHAYRVVRTLSSAELYLDGASAPIANSTSGVTDLLRRRLGMSQQEFFNTYFTGQKELGVISAMPPAERAQFLSRVLGYERLRTAQTLIRDRRNSLKGEITGVQSAMPDAEGVARALRDAETQLKVAEDKNRDAAAKQKKSDAAVAKITPQWIKAQQQREASLQSASELRVLAAEETALAGDAERLSTELSEITGARDEVAAMIEELRVYQDVEKQLHEMNRLFQEEGRRRALLQNKTSLTTEIERLRKRAAGFAAARDDLVAAEKARDAARRDLEEASALHEILRVEWIRDRQEALTKREERLAYHRQVKEQRERLADLGPDSPCPICTRPLADHFREVIDDLDGKLSEIEVEGRYYRNRVDQLSEAPPPVRELADRVKVLEQQVDAAGKALGAAQLREQERTQVTHDLADREGRMVAIDAELAKVPSGYHATRHANLKQQLEALAPLVEQAARLSALTDREPIVRKEIDRVNKALARVRDRVAKIKAKQAELTFSETAFAELRTKFDATVADQRAAELAALGAEKELEAARAARQNAEANRKAIERAQETLRGLTVDRRMHDELDQSFTDIRATLNEHLRPEISELASAFLSDLTDGRYTDLELDEDYNIIVKEDDIPKPVISGGEEDLAYLVLRLAISQMIAERAGQSFSLLVLDEVFGSLDDTRRHNVVELLRRLHDRFEQVIVITHIESVREGLDRVLMVRYDEEAGVSRVQQESASALDELADGAYDVVAVGAD